MADSQALPYAPCELEERVGGWVCPHTHLTTSWPCIAGGSHSGADQFGPSLGWKHNAKSEHWKASTFLPHLHNNNRTISGSHCMPGWFQCNSRASEDGDTAECRGTLVALWIKRGGMEKADVFSAPTASGRQRMDRMAAEWISGQILYEHVIICSASHSPSTLWPYYPVNLWSAHSEWFSTRPWMRSQNTARQTVKAFLDEAETLELYPHGNNNLPWI